MNKDWGVLNDTVSQVLEQVKQQGATAAEVAISVESGLSASVRLGEVDTVEFHQDKLLGLTVYKGQHKGSVTTTDLRPEALKTLIEAACRIAGYAEEDPYAGLADREMMADQIPELDLYHPWRVTPEEAIAWAKQCEAAAMNFDPRISNSEGANFSSHSRYRVYGNSHGFLGAYPSTRHSMSCTVIGQTGESMQRDHDYTIARDGHDLEPWEKIGQRAAERTLNRLNARKIKTTQAPVIFSAEMATGIISHFISAISGGNLYRKSSFLLDYLGKSVFPEFVQIKEVPHIPRALGSAPFDHEGVATKQRDIVQNGVLQSYVLSSYSARKLGLKSTGNSGGIHNLLLSHSDKDLEDLLKQMDRGLLVTELLGHGVNIVTGDYSRGAAGFWVENGEIQFPVEEVTIAGNLKEMFLHLVAIGNDIEKRSSILTGSLLFEQMTIAGS